MYVHNYRADDPLFRHAYFTRLLSSPLTPNPYRQVDNITLYSPQVFWKFGYILILYIKPPLSKLLLWR